MHTLSGPLDAHWKSLFFGYMYLSYRDGPVIRLVLYPGDNPSWFFQSAGRDDEEDFYEFHFLFQTKSP